MSEIPVVFPTEGPPVPLNDFKKKRYHDIFRTRRCYSFLQTQLHTTGREFFITNYLYVHPGHLYSSLRCCAIRDSPRPSLAKVGGARPPQLGGGNATTIEDNLMWEVQVRQFWFPRELNWVTTDRHVLILWQNETRGSRKVFRHLLDLWDAIF